jgi:tryptophan 2-monooxygenase
MSDDKSHENKVDVTEITQSLDNLIAEAHKIPSSTQNTAVYSNETLSSEVAGKNWRQPYPGPADRNFHFRKLLKNSPQGIGAAKNKNLKVAIIGTGAAGLTAAYELARSGLENIDMFEATDRYGGRLWTQSVDNYDGAQQFTVMDFGAMRMPPFIPHDEKIYPAGSPTRQGQIWKQGSAVLAHYLDRFGLRTSEFPNPGSKHCKSGIYYNEGSFQPVGSKSVKKSNDDNNVDIKTEEKTEFENTDYTVYNSDKTAKGQLLVWNTDQDDPPNEELREVQKLWVKFSTRMKDYIKKYYDTEEWPAFWNNIVRNYYNKTFRQVVRDDFVDNIDENLKGNFGGVGLNEKQARILFVIGCGDGGWGAFYNVSFLFVYRTLLHGYGDNHQVIEGLFHFDAKGNKEIINNIDYKDETLNGSQYLGNNQGETVIDSLGNKFDSPEYLGLHSIPDGLLFGALHKEAPKSPIYHNLKTVKEADGYHLFLNSPVSKIERDSKSKKVRLHVKTTNKIHGDHEFSDVEYDAVIITVPTHQFGMEIEVAGFDDKMWPYDLQSYLSQAYWIPCAKVFLELKVPYWEIEDCTIPQMIASETFTRDTYGIKVNRGEIDKQTGLLLISYTWTRDATKLVSYDDQELINMCVKELDRMLANCKNVRKQDRISNYAQDLGTIDEYGETNYKGTVHHWEKQKYYKGAARFYDQLGWNSTRVPMTYNQEKSKESKLYFAGEGYHADAGWVEPAFRSAIDAVLHLFNNNGVNLQVEDNFNFDTDYAKYDMKFDPTSPSVPVSER